MTTHSPVARPGSVTVVVLLTWLVALLSILGGIFLLLASDQFLADAQIAASTATNYGWVQVVFGVVTALVAIGLGNGNSISRALVTLLMLLRMIAAGWAAIVIGGSAWWSSMSTGLVALAVLSLLWNGRADTFFRTH